MELNIVERAIKTEIDTVTEYEKGVAKLGWFISLTDTVTSPPREGEPAGTPNRELKQKDEMLY